MLRIAKKYAKPFSTSKSLCIGLLIYLYQTLVKAAI
jgi:hypothetical protein